MNHIFNNNLSYKKKQKRTEEVLKKYEDKLKHLLKVVHLRFTRQYTSPYSSQYLTKKNTKKSIPLRLCFTVKRNKFLIRNDLISFHRNPENRINKVKRKIKNKVFIDIPISFKRFSCVLIKTN